jgi:hypothetical protein
MKLRGSFARCFDFFNSQLQVDQRLIRFAARIFQIHPNDPGLNQFARRHGGIFRIGTISGFDVSSHRHMNRASNAADACEHLFTWNVLAVGITQRECDARGGSC